MSIGITTIIGDNYGSALQSYALQKAFLQYGDEASYILDIIPRRTWINFLRTRVLPNKSYSLKVRIKKLFSDIKYSDKRTKIKRFYDKNIKIKRYPSIKELALSEKDTNVFVAGSDQVWNPYFGFSSLRYLKFVENANSVKYSYAASIGVSEIDNIFIESYKDRLSDYKTISLRENTGKKLIEEIMKSDNVRQDLDPVFLLDKDNWESLASKRFVGQDYIFVYMLRPQPELLDYAIKLGEQYNKKVYYIGEHYYKKKNLITITDAGVEDFLSCIKNASFVLTNSFHATAFSVIFNKTFSSVVISRTGSRVEDFLKMIGLENRIIKDYVINNELFEQIDFSKAIDIIENYRKHSIEYVKEIAFSAKG